MKRVLRSKPIPIVQSGQPTGDVYTDRDFLRGVVTTDQRFCANADGARSGARIVDVLDATTDAATPLDFEDADAKILREAVEEPKPALQGMVPYGFQPAYRLVPFIDAVANAQAVKRAEQPDAPANGVASSPS